MNKILIYGNRKCGEDAWDISTPALRAGAYLKLFTILDRDWQAYVDLEEPHKLDPICEPCEKDLHRYCEHTDTCSCEDKACMEEYSRGEFNRRTDAGWRKLYLAAKEGDAAAAEKLITARSAAKYEYENAVVLEVQQVKAKV